MRLEPLDFWLELPASGPLLPQLREALGRHLGGASEPLRWAITAAEPTASGGRRLRVEAVLLHPEEE
ncbi:MAG: hypothetical protein ACKOCM_09520 [Cyanobacteriota bacterium]